MQFLVFITQLALTGFIATRLGVIALLVTIPVVMVFGLTVYAAFGTFSVMAAAMVLRRWGEYAFIRPGREMLFSKVDSESKYKAKNVCDVAVYRIADASFAQIKKLLDAFGMGGVAQAMIAAAVAGAVGGQWLVAGAALREGSLAPWRRSTRQYSRLRDQTRHTRVRRPCRHRGVWRLSCGSVTRKRVYSPGLVAMPTRPPALLTSSRTTSMPMPRAPSPTVVKPARKMKLASLRGSILVASAVLSTPWRTASARILSWSRPRPSSCTLS